MIRSTPASRYSPIRASDSSNVPVTPSPANSSSMESASVPRHSASRPARRRRSAASLPETHGTMTENVIDAGSRPASRHAASTTARRSAHSAGVA